MALEHGQKRRWRKAENIPAHNVSRLYNPIYACSRKDSQVVVMLMTMVTMILIGLAPPPLLSRSPHTSRSRGRTRFQMGKDGHPGIENTNENIDAVIHN